MATYIILNFVVMGAIAFYMLCRWERLQWRYIIIIGLIMLGLTAVFDSLIIYFDIVAYDTTKTLGFNIGKAPVEDFAYTVVAVIMVPYIWKKLKNI